MKRLISFMLIVIALMASSIAQSQSLKKWSDGMLSWNDFKGKAVMSSVPSAISVSLNTTTHAEETSGKKIKYKIETEAVMNSNESYADPESMTPQRLRYHQLQFDQLELQRRRLQNELNTGINGIEADNRLNHYRNLYKDQIASIKKETEDGTNDKKLQEWEYYTRKGLEEIGLPPIPEFEPSNWCYGIYLGVGHVFNSSELKDFYGNCFTFTAGLTGGYKRLKLKADIGYGQADIKEPNIFGKTTVTPDGATRPVQGPMSKTANYLSVGTSLGFSVINSKRFAITPFAGVHWSGYSWNMANLEWVENPETKKYESKVKNTEDCKLKDVSWIAGVDFDFKIYKHVSSRPFFLTGQREQFTSSIRITPYVAHAKYNHIGASGYHAGITISYSGIARSLKMK